MDRANKMAFKTLSILYQDPSLPEPTQTRMPLKVELSKPEHAKSDLSQTHNFSTIRMSMCVFIHQGPLMWLLQRHQICSEIHSNNYFKTGRKALQLL